MRLTLFLGAVLAAGCQPTPKHPGLTQRLTVLADTDHDGTVTVAEIDALRLPGDPSPSGDTNGDGILQPIELEAWFLKTSPSESQQEAQLSLQPRRHPPRGPQGAAQPASSSPAPMPVAP